MWIKNDNPATERLSNADLFDGDIEFNENGTANVPRDVAQQLIDQYDSIHEYNP